MNSEQTVRAAFADQARWCDQLGSPFTAQLMRALGEHLRPGTPVGDRVRGWQGDPNAMADSVPLRLAGALHALVRAGQAPDLALLYPPAPLPEGAFLARTALATLATHSDTVLKTLEYAPQTNEPGRAAALYAGLLCIAALYPQPFELLELGASAGLNLIPDRYRYTFGGQDYGDPASPVHLAPSWTGPAPPQARVAIARRGGCDLNPLDIQDAEQRARLLSYIWPDQTERLNRAEGALALALRDPPMVDQADAAAWLDMRLAAPQSPQTTRVIWHSIAAQYFPNAVQSQIAAALQAAGAAATPEAPLAHLALEQDGKRGPALTLQLWPDGAKRTLATANAHVQGVNWAV